MFRKRRNMPRCAVSPAVAAALVVACLAAGCGTPAAKAPSRQDLLAQRATYPAHWWAEVSGSGAPDWEILPQEAGPGEVIVSKRHELGLLSNFAATPFSLRGRRYASVEGFWQMMLYPEGPDDPRATFPGIVWAYSREQVAQLTSFEAKHAGELAEQNMKRTGITWVSFEGRRFEYHPDRPGDHYALIVEAMREKVRQNPDVRRVLLSTGNLVLKPDHHEEAGARAAWRYCDILMQLRGEFQRGAGAGPRPGGPASAVAEPPRN
jgi:predicted NAD-dependent protein-ADP-ribosyltransferase YbiA (DUF1768 family)